LAFPLISYILRIRRESALTRAIIVTALENIKEIETNIPS